MALYNNVNGTIRETTHKYENVNGTIREVSTKYENVNGTIREVLNNKRKWFVKDGNVLVDRIPVIFYFRCKQGDTETILYEVSEYGALVYMPSNGYWGLEFPSTWVNQERVYSPTNVGTGTRHFILLPYYKNPSNSFAMHCETTKYEYKTDVVYFTSNGGWFNFLTTSTGFNVTNTIFTAISSSDSVRDSNYIAWTSFYNMPSYRQTKIIIDNLKIWIKNFYIDVS